MRRAEEAPFRLKLDDVPHGTIFGSSEWRTSRRLLAVALWIQGRQPLADQGTALFLDARTLPNSSACLAGGGGLRSVHSRHKKKQNGNFASTSAGGL